MVVGGNSNIGAGGSVVNFNDNPLYNIDTRVLYTCLYADLAREFELGSKYVTKDEIKSELSQLNYQVSSHLFSNRDAMIILDLNWFLLCRLVLELLWHLAQIQS